MFPALINFAWRMMERGDWQVGRVLEIGSCNVNGTIRDALEMSASEWIGVDLQEGPCVDLIMPSDKLVAMFGEESFDTVVSCECLEHDLRPWITVDAMRKLLRPGGHMLVTTPTFGFPLHRYPIDCFRFGEDAYRGWIYEGYNVIALETTDDPAGYPCITAFGQKPVRT